MDENVIPLPVPLLRPDDIIPRSADAVRAGKGDLTGGSTRCTAMCKATGEQCAKWAVVATEPPRCASHGAQVGSVLRMRADERLELHDFEQQLEQAQKRALNVVIALADDATDDKTRLAAAKDLLDRGGHGAVRKVEQGQPGAFAQLDVDTEIERMLSGGEGGA
jgi:hypothetical protein